MRSSNRSIVSNSFNYAGINVESSKNNNRYLDTSLNSIILDFLSSIKQSINIYKPR